MSRPDGQVVADPAVRGNVAVVTAWCPGWLLDSGIQPTVPRPRFAFASCV